MTHDTPVRASVWWANPNPVVGSEIAKRRLIVVPLSSRSDAHPPVSVAVTCRGRDVIAVVDQIRAIDKSRLLESIEIMTPDELDAIRNALDDLI